jgi:hypothetical protein
MDSLFTLRLPLTERDLATLAADGHATFFVSLPIDGDEKVVHVDLYHKKLYDLIYSAAGIKQGLSERMHPELREGARLERQD